MISGALNSAFFKCFFCLLLLSCEIIFSNDKISLPSLEVVFGVKKFTLPQKNQKDFQVFSKFLRQKNVLCHIEVEQWV